jgi:hypothetical protein
MSYKVADIKETSLSSGRCIQNTDKVHYAEVFKDFRLVFDNQRNLKFEDFKFKGRRLVGLIIFEYFCILGSVYLAGLDFSMRFLLADFYPLAYICLCLLFSVIVLSLLGPSLNLLERMLRYIVYFVCLIVLNCFASNNTSETGVICFYIISISGLIGVFLFMYMKNKSYYIMALIKFISSSAGFILCLFYAPNQMAVVYSYIISLVFGIYVQIFLLLIPEDIHKGLSSKRTIEISIFLYIDIFWFTIDFILSIIFKIK